MRGLAALREHGVEWNALTTVNAANQAHPAEVYRFLRDDCGCEFIQLIPIVERPCEDGVPQGTRGDRPVRHARGLGRFLIGVFDEWVRRDVGAVFVQLFDVALANWYGEPSGLCVHTASCGTALAMEFNGDVYACDHFVEPEYLRGNIHEPTSPSSRRPRRRSASATASRRRCRATAGSATCASPATAAASRTASCDPGREPGLNYLCPGYKDFFHHVDEPMRRMCDLLRQKRAPADIVAEYRARE